MYKVKTETGELPLKATTKLDAVIEILNMLFDVELIGGQQKPQFERTCIACDQPFKTMDKRYRRCPECRSAKPEHEVMCIVCTRSFKTVDGRLKTCSYCVSRKYNMGVPEMKKYCKECEQTECDKQECKHFKELTGGK